MYNDAFHIMFIIYEHFSKILITSLYKGYKILNITN